MNASQGNQPENDATFVAQDDSCGSAAVVTYTARDTFNGH